MVLDFCKDRELENVPKTHNLKDEYKSVSFKESKVFEDELTDIPMDSPGCCFFLGGRGC